MEDDIKIFYCYLLRKSKENEIQKTRNINLVLTIYGSYLEVTLSNNPINHPNSYVHITPDKICFWKYYLTLLCETVNLPTLHPFYIWT